MLLHEHAHLLEFGDKHGPAFVATYITVLVQFLEYDAGDLREQARRARVRVA